MKELDLQDKYLINFLCERQDGLGYKEVKPNTISRQFFILEDLKHFLSQTDLNKANYRKLLRKIGDENKLINKLLDLLSERIRSSQNMAVFINSNKTISFEGETLHLFYPSGSETHEDTLFDQNIFSVVKELPYTFEYQEKKLFSFRPDLSFFINGIFLSYSELKSSYNNQNARRNGRNKIKNDYLKAVQEYLIIADGNDWNKSIRKEFLKIFEKSVHITATDVNETYIIRNITTLFDEIKEESVKGLLNFDTYANKFFDAFKAYPISNPNTSKTKQFEATFRALYDKKMVEKEILYYNFIERELIKKEGKKNKTYKHNDGRLICPRPKQKFGTDKILKKIDEFLEHENEPDYFLNQLKQKLRSQGIGDVQINELVEKRNKYQNNKYVYSLLMQYAAGFGKSNIIGWTALQLKDLRRNGEYIYDKIMLVVDRLQLRDQLDSKMHNMNISKKMFTEADNQKAFVKALSGNTRIIVVNLQKFNTIKDILADEVTEKLAKFRIAFLIDEIHRSNTGTQHSEMISLFDELQSTFDNNKAYQQLQIKKNLIIGFTATPSDNSLARFGEFSRVAENVPIWVPFDSYTIKEAIDDKYILNPINGIVPVSAKMYYELPESNSEGFENDTGYDRPDDQEATEKKYAIRKKKIYENPERIDAIAKFVVNRLVSSVYHNIRGQAKAMLAVSSIKAAIRYKTVIDRYFKEITTDQKYRKFSEAPIHIVYSESQEHQSPSGLNNGLTEVKVLQNFALKKNGLIIVVDKLQTGFDEPKLHTLFLDKEIAGINAIQTISRVNRTTKYKNDCKIIDFSHQNINVDNIKKAFDHFSNVVISKFNPFENEAVLISYYDELKKHSLFIAHFHAFNEYKKTGDVSVILKVTEAFKGYILANKEQAEALKIKINEYFYILNLIEYVLSIDSLYSNARFLDFWRRFNNEYNNLNRTGGTIDDVEIYFDNKLGIIAPPEKKDEPQGGKNTVGGGTDYKYDILKIIEQRNEKEAEIEKLIIEFEKKIERFFDYIHTDQDGMRLIAKIKAGTSAFNQEDIYVDFAKIYRKFIRRNKDIGEFFIKETKSNTIQLCDDFENSLKSMYTENTLLSRVAENKQGFEEN